MKNMNIACVDIMEILEIGAVASPQPRGWHPVVMARYNETQSYYADAIDAVMS